MNREELVKAIRDEVDFWMNVPAGRAGASGEMIPPMLMRLADRIESGTDQ